MEDQGTVKLSVAKLNADKQTGDTGKNGARAEEKLVDI